jgi:magnesium-transporting ATPase (P-type)
MEFARAAGLCNDAVLHGARRAGWRVEGDPMEGALLALAGKITGEGPEPFRNGAAPTRSPSTRRIATWRCCITTMTAMPAFMSRARPRRCWPVRPSAPPMAGRAARPGILARMVEALAAEGQRVIAVATRAVPQDHTILNTRSGRRTLTLIGLIGLIDPPRAEAIEAVAECHAPASG